MYFSPPDGNFSILAGFPKSSTTLSTFVWALITSFLLAASILFPSIIVGPQPTANTNRSTDIRPANLIFSSFQGLRYKRPLLKLSVSPLRLADSWDKKSHSNYPPTDFTLTGRLLSLLRGI